MPGARDTVRVIFSKVEPGEHYSQIASGTWNLGCEPDLRGEAIPLPVLRGLEVQLCDTAEPLGTLIYDLSDVRYAMDYQKVEGAGVPGPLASSPCE